MRPTTPRPLVLLAVAAALAFAPPAHARRTLTLKVPKFVVPPRSDKEVCTFVPIPSKANFDVAASVVVNVGVNKEFVSHHFLLWSYDGSDLGSFPARGQLVESKACLDFGPSDTNNRTLITGSQSPILKTKLPTGLAQQIVPATVSGSGAKVIGFILNSHWINSSDRPQKAAVRVKLVAARKHTVRQYLLPIFEVTANAFIDVPPDGVKTESASWTPGGADFGRLFGGGVVPKGPACVVMLSSHMHKRGKLFSVDFVKGGGAPSEQVLSTTSYSDPPQVTFTPPMLVEPGEQLRYTCTHDNGMTTTTKLGCEEQPGVAPGKSVLAVLGHGGGFQTSGAAKRCSTMGPDAAECPSTDPALPGRTFTGNCVKANLVFGFTSDDDMCILPGSFYPANDQGNCDLSGLKIQN